MQTAVAPSVWELEKRVLSWKTRLLTFETRIVAKRCSTFDMGVVAINRIQPPKIMVLYGPRSVFLTALSVCVCVCVRLC